ncbi:MAG: molybdenum cofactor biosynthesis protein MoaE [Desulfosarcinaceae bacterium]|nr:molybdenum cofactor biosynthesis protein MoaE [Desulfosarcinaceae bacterium]
MDIQKQIDRIKAHPDAAGIGMILCHNGVVRGTSREGRPVSGLTVRVDEAKLEAVLAAHRKMPGIVDIQVEIVADRPLAVGDDVMALVVGGDIRENVIAALSATLNAIKSEVTHKTQFFTDDAH